MVASLIDAVIVVIRMKACRHRQIPENDLRAFPGRVAQSSLNENRRGTGVLIRPCVSTASRRRANAELLHRGRR